ncbi:hypothetical protein YPPY61_0960, partial [Yersinia pestis PY-61]
MYGIEQGDPPLLRQQKRGIQQSAHQQAAADDGHRCYRSKAAA